MAGANVDKYLARCVLLLGASGTACGMDEPVPDAAASPSDLRDAELETSDAEGDADVGDSSPHDAATADEPAFTNPWMDLATLPSPTPILDDLNDEHGRRYVIGEGAMVESEGGTSVALPSLMTMVRRPMTADELAEATAEQAPAVQEPAKIAPSLQTTLDDLADPDTLLNVIIFANDDEVGWQVELHRAMARGIVTSRSEQDQLHSRYINERRERNSARLAPLVASVERLGGTVLDNGGVSPWIHARLPAGSIAALATEAELAKIDVAEVPGTPLGVDGTEVRHGIQLKTYLDNDFDGEGNSNLSGDELIAAIIELNFDGGGNPVSFLASHNGLRETLSVSEYRYGDAPETYPGRWDCAPTPCDDVSAFSEPAGSHATGIAGVIFGDLVDGQIADADPESASGYAPEARGHMYLANTATQAIAAMSHIQNLDPLWADIPHVVNNSYQFSYTEACDGTDVMSREVNDLYENGFAVFAGAGNGGGSATNCKVRPPAAAIGAMAIGAHMDDTAADGPLEVRSEPIYDSVTEVSAWGGNDVQDHGGQNRSLVALTAPGRRTRRFYTDGTISNGATGTPAATSLASATVSGAALSIMDHRMSGGSTFIDAPGALYAALLAMGDRQQTSGYGDHTPDHRWGVGRLRARYIGTGGMDAPWYYYFGATCISNAEVYDFYISQNPFPADVDVIKAAAFWYDTRHDVFENVANVNIKFHVSNLQAIVSDNDSSDNKAWVFHDNPPDDVPVFLRFFGSNVSGHNDPTCGANSILVYFLWFAEDSDRESPTYDELTGTGVFPEEYEFP